MWYIPSMMPGITIILNGLEERVPPSCTVAQLIQMFNEDHPDLIAELNGRFLHPREYSSTRVRPGDRVEFIHAAFGG